MDVVLELSIIAVIMAVSAIIIYFEAKIIRRRRSEREKVTEDRDEAYNILETTKAIASSLRSQGRDVLSAEMLLTQAENALQRHDIQSCKDLSNKAKDILISSKKAEPAGHISEEDASGPAPVLQENKERAPENYLESKFMMETVYDLAERSPQDLRMRALAELNLAKLSFSKGEYTEALRSAMRAKRVMDPECDLDKKGSAVELKSSSAANAEDPSNVVGHNGPLTCSKCGKEAMKGDLFCPACGSRLTPRICGSCGKEMQDDDMFCRKCGIRASNDQGHI